MFRGSDASRQAPRRAQAPMPAFMATTSPHPRPAPPPPPRPPKEEKQGFRFGVKGLGFGFVSEPSGIGHLQYSEFSGVYPGNFETVGLGRDR